MSYELSGWTEPTLEENLIKAGFDRRDFLKYCGELAAVFAVGGAVIGSASPASAASVPAEVIAEKLGAVKKPLVVWLQLQECTGCMESTLRSGGTTIEDAVLRLLSVEYNELVMPAAGDAANKALDDANAQPHLLVVNGSIPVKDGGIYCTIGGKSAEQVLRESAKNASLGILAVGACAVWGSVQASKPNPTGAVGVDAIITDKPVVNVAGCPPIGEVITATVAYVLTNGRLPKLDAQGRPLFAYDQRIHDSCQRRAHFDAGQFVRSFDDDGARNGWCLYEVGCKGPSTFAACPIIKWNKGTSWPIQAGHPCLGCTEKNFFDNYTPFYQTLPNVGGFGVESTAEAIGLGVVGIAAAGVALHAGATAVKQAASRRAAEGNEPLQAFGDSERVWLPNPKKVEVAPEAPAAETTDDSEKAE